jgi:hypothetical protein
MQKNFKFGLGETEWLGFNSTVLEEYPYVSHNQNRFAASAAMPRV